MHAVTTTLSREILVSLATMKGFQEIRLGKKQTVRDLTNHVCQLGKSGIDIHNLALSIDGDGKFRSDDIAKFITDSERNHSLLKEHRSGEIEFFGDYISEACEFALSPAIVDDEETTALINQAKKILQL